MKKVFFLILSILFLSLLLSNGASAQCAICAKSVQQMGTKPAEGFNSGIIYLMALPYAAIGIIGYKWWKHNR